MIGMVAKNFLGNAAGELGLLNIRVSPEANAAPVARYVGLVCSPAFVEPNAMRAGFVSVVQGHVAKVFTVRDAPKVCDPVIQRIAIDVVNHIFRPFAVVMRPRDSMGSNPLAPDGADVVAPLAYAS